MSRMYDNDDYPSRNSGDNLQLTNWILDSGAICHIAPEVSDFIPSSIYFTDKHIEVADGHHVMAKKNWQVQIKLCYDNGDNLSSYCTTYFWYHIYTMGYYQ